MTLAHERTSEFFEGARRVRRQIITPEGVPLAVDLADYGERLVAFVIDLFIWFLLTLAVYLPIIWAIGVTGHSLLAISVAPFIGFLVRNLYFVYFELAWRGSTPGKRMVGLRVIDRAIQAHGAAGVQRAEHLDAGLARVRALQVQGGELAGAAQAELRPLIRGRRRSERNR